MTQTSTLDARAGTVLDAIGRTPLVRLKKIVPPDAADVVVKVEYTNPTGSYKDRMALAMVEGAERRGQLRAGMRVLEFTGGSTGNSLAMVCAVKGYRFTVVTNDAVAIEKRLAMRALGAEVIEIDSGGGKITPTLVARMKERTMALAAEPGTYFTDQFYNMDALDGYGAMARELLEQVGGPERLDAYCGCVGTGGMIRGVARGLAEAGCRAAVYALEPTASAVMSGGTPGVHTLEGVAPGFVPPHMAEKPYTAALAIDEQEGRAIARRMATEEGIFAGTSSGLNIAAAIRIAQELGPGRLVATVAVDTGNKYLAGDLYR